LEERGALKRNLSIMRLCGLSTKSLPKDGVIALKRRVVRREAGEDSRKEVLKSVPTLD